MSFKSRIQSSREIRNHGRLAGLLLTVSLMCLWVLFGMGRSVHAEDAQLSIQFMNADGSRVLAVRYVEPGGQVTLPSAPKDSQVGTAKAYGAPAWKTVQGSAEDAMIFASRQVLTYSAVKDWAQEYGQEQTLTLYATKACRVQYRTAEGKPMSAYDFVYEGTHYTYRKSPNEKNTCYKGWTLTKGSVGIDFKFGAAADVWEPQNIYLITYYSVQFRNRDGSRSTAMDRLAKVVAPGTVITMPKTEVVLRYQNMGWSTFRNSYRLAVGEGQKYTVNSNVIFYQVRKYQPYQVKFADNSGISSAAAYQRLAKYAYQDEWLTLPELPAVKGYVALGWAKKAKQTAPDYKAGDRLQIRGNTTYYAVYRKANRFWVEFVAGDGTTSAEYKKLNCSVYEGSVITLPALPAKKNYMDKGWRIRVDGKVVTYKPGSKFTVTGRCRFYAWQAVSANLILYNANGKVSRSLILEKGSNYTLPSYANTAAYTFLGWAYQPRLRATHANPIQIPFQAGEQIKVNGTVRLYPVLAMRSAEGSVSLSKLVSMTRSAEEKYPEILLVGDSRTVRLGQTLNSMSFFGTEVGKHVSVIAEYGQGIRWFKESGYAAVKEKVKSIRSSGQEGTIAIVFNLGVNDASNAPSYIAYMNKISEELTSLNCRLYYMSANPLNSAQMKLAQENGSTNVSPKTEVSVRYFNRELRAKLNSDYTFLDCYSWLMSCGYSTDKGYNLPSGQNMGVDDGLHYTVNTYKWIYHYLLEALRS